MFITDGTLESLLESDLYSLGWDGSLEPYPGQSVYQFSLMSQRNSLVKKYLPGTSPSNPSGDKKAIALFLECNERCAGFSLDSSPRTEVEEIVLGQMKLFLYDFFVPNPYQIRYSDVPTRKVRTYATPRDPIWYLGNITRFLDVGPGASVATRSANFYTKFANSGLSCTSAELHKLYVQTISYNPTWSACEELRAQSMGVVIVSGSRLSCVAKNRKISRTICTEPLLNMIFQKGLGSAIEERLREVIGINLSTQPDENAELARIGSLSGKFGTIDLSSASDTISLSLVRSLLPRPVVAWLEMFRSPRTTLPGGEEVELHMLSSMGNGYTFPLQTLLFTAVVKAVYEVMGLRFHHFRDTPNRKGSSTFAVFGDDIIVYKEAYDLVVRMLTLLGFSVNLDKSFNDGFFRESCGHDYYHGRNVRGVYLQHLYDVYDCYSAINRLNRWSAEHGAPLPLLVQSLLRRVPKKHVPYEESDDAGIKVPLSLATSAHHERSGLVSYRYFKLDATRIKLPVRSKKISQAIGWFENPDGLLMSFLAGRILRGSIGVRSNSRSARLLRRSTPRWDWIPLAGGESHQYRDNWKVVTEINLLS